MSLQFTFRVANNTICKIIPETCKAIFQVLREDYFKVIYNLYHHAISSNITKSLIYIDKRKHMFRKILVEN
jgi:adenosine deaminase